MPVSPPQIRPQTPKTTTSLPNPLHHGLSGEGVALPNEEIAEVERRFEAFLEELQPSGELGKTLVRRVAFLSIRLDRCVSHDTASLRDRLRRAEAEFVVPEGVDPETVAQLRAEAKARVMFDPSPEAALARRFEAATERAFHRALKEFRQVEKQVQAKRVGLDAAAFEETLGSLFQLQKKLDEVEARQLEPDPIGPLMPSPGYASAAFDPFEKGVDVPIMISRRR